MLNAIERPVLMAGYPSEVSQIAAEFNIHGLSQDFTELHTQRPSLEVVMSPKTATGKGIVRLNGVRHGMRTVLPVIKTESPAEWEAHRYGILQSLGPDGALELALAERVALLLWRLARIARYETASVMHAQERAAGDHANATSLHAAYVRPAIEARARAAGIELPPALPSHPDDLATEVRWLNSRARLLRAFPTIPEDANLGDDAASIVNAVAQVAGVKVTGRIEAQTAGDVRLAIAALAARVKREPADLLAQATEDAEREAHAGRYELNKAQAAVSRMEAERQIPDAEVLDKLIRYEAHLNRQLLHTLHELEAMQSRRQGGPAPLARIDVSGMAGK